MASFVAVVLVCLKSVSPDACNEATAVDYISNTVPNEMRCLTGWQETVAGSSLGNSLGTLTYVKTICRPAAERPPLDN